MALLDLDETGLDRSAGADPGAAGGGADVGGSGVGVLIAVVVVVAGIGALALVVALVPALFILIFAGGSPTPTSTAAGGALPASVAGIPAQVLDGYEQAAAAAPKGCRMRWEILAGIGQTESGHAGGRTIHADGTVFPPIYGPALPNGVRAEGPMQFLPSSWTLFTTGKWAVAGHSGLPDPENVYDAPRAAANHLCSTSGSVATPAALKAAVYGYNPSAAYVATVTSRIAAYDAAAADPVAGPAGGPAGGVGGGSALAQAAVAAEQSRLGTPYVFGAAGPNAYDCSSYTQMAYLVASHGRINIGRTTYQQVANTAILKPVPLSQLQPGDLVYISVSGDAQAGWNHVVMYVGGGKLIEEPRPPLASRVAPFSEYDRYPRTALRVRA